MQILKTFRDNLIPIIYLDVIWVSHANFFVNTQHLNGDPETHKLVKWKNTHHSQRWYNTLKPFDSIIRFYKCNVCGRKMELLKEYQNIVDLQNTSECVKRNQIYSSVKSRYTCAWSPCWNHGA